MKTIQIIVAMMFLSMPMAAQSHKKFYRQGMPTSLPMNTENIEWQRDIYRELDLTRDANAGLYHLDNGENLFTRIFNLVLCDSVKAYEFVLDDDEVFDKRAEVDIKRVMTDFDIFYTDEDSVLTVDASDMPATEVISYYIKETVYYDSTNSMFRTQLAAICPVVTKDDEFGLGLTKHPMFWVRYQDIEPFLHDMLIYPSSRNMAAKVALPDYFVRNMYKGDIYKVSNIKGVSLPQYCENHSAMDNERKKIEKELIDVRRNAYNSFRKR